MQKRPLVSVVVSFPIVLRRFRQQLRIRRQRALSAKHRGRHASDDLLSGLTAQTFGIHHSRTMASPAPSQPLAQRKCQRQLAPPSTTANHLTAQAETPTPKAWVGVADPNRLRLFPFWPLHCARPASARNPPLRALQELFGPSGSLTGVRPKTSLRVVGGCPPWP
jgi:hypothetical protein